MMEAHAALAPFLELRDYIFGYQHCVFRAANQFVFFRLAFWGEEAENRVTIRRRDRDPTSRGFIVVVDYESEAKLIHVKPQAFILVADEDVDAEQAQVGVLLVQTNAGR